jgi:hypothetical protein
VGADAPFVYWRLGETTGTVAADASGNARPGTYAGGVGLNRAGALAGDGNPSVQLDGADDNIVRNPIAGVGTTAISTDLWLETTDTTKEAGIVSYAATSSADEFQLRDYRALRVYIKGTRVDTGVALNDGQWHHLAVTWTSTGGAVRVYKDGALAFSNSVPVQAGTTITGGGALVLGQEQDTIGGGFETSQAFLGQLDEVALYPTALSAARVKAHRDAGITSGCATGVAATGARTVALKAESFRAPRMVEGSELLPSLPPVGTPVRGVTDVVTDLALAEPQAFCPLEVA